METTFENFNIDETTLSELENFEGLFKLNQYSILNTFERKVTLVLIALLPIQILYTIQMQYYTTVISKEKNTYCTIIAVISTVLLGYFNDKMNVKIGRRKFLIFIAFLLMLISLVLNGWKEDFVAQYLNYPNNAYTMIIVIVSFALCLSSFLIVEFCVLSLIVDYVPHKLLLKTNRIKKQIKEMGKIIAYTQLYLVIKHQPNDTSDNIKILFIFSLVFIGIMFFLINLSLVERQWVPLNQDIISKSNTLTRKKKSISKFRTVFLSINYKITIVLIVALLLGFITQEIGIGGPQQTTHIDSSYYKIVYCLVDFTTLFVILVFVGYESVDLIIPVNESKTTKFMKKLKHKIRSNMLGVKNVVLVCYSVVGLCLAIEEVFRLTSYSAQIALGLLLIPFNSVIKICLDTVFINNCNRNTKKELSIEMIHLSNNNYYENLNANKTNNNEFNALKSSIYVVLEHLGLVLHTLLFDQDHSSTPFQFKVLVFLVPIVSLILFEIQNRL